MNDREREKRLKRKHLEKRVQMEKIWGKPVDSPAGMGGLTRKAQRAKRAHHGLPFIEYLSQRVRYNKDHPNKYQQGPPGSDNR